MLMYPDNVNTTDKEGIFSTRPQNWIEFKKKECTGMNRRDWSVFVSWASDQRIYQRKHWKFNKEQDANWISKNRKIKQCCLGLFSNIKQHFIFAWDFLKKSFIFLVLSDYLPLFVNTLFQTVLWSSSPKFALSFTSLYKQSRGLCSVPAELISSGEPKVVDLSYM